MLYWYFKVDYETLEAKLEKQKPKPTKAEKAAQQKAEQQARQQAAAAQSAASMTAFPGGPDLGMFSVVQHNNTFDLEHFYENCKAQMGITPEIMAQLMSSGMDPKQLLSMAANPFGGSPAVKKNKNDPSQQKVQLINIRTFQKLDKKKAWFCT